MRACLWAALLCPVLAVSSCDRLPTLPALGQKEDQSQPAPPASGRKEDRSQPPGRDLTGKSLLVVGGMNYEDLSRIPFFIDPVLRKDLEGLGLSVGECRWSELTWDKLKQFDAAIFLQTPNLPSGDLEKEPLFAKMRELTKRYLEAGGGVLVFPDLFRGRIEPTINLLLQPYDIKVTSDELRTDLGRQQPFEAYPALGRTLTRLIAAHRTTRGSSEVWLPVGSELGFGIKPGASWFALLQGPEGSWAEPAEAAGKSGSEKHGEPPIIAACRDAGPGRLAVFASHSSFWVLNPFHEFWDNGVILREGDGRHFLLGLLEWLADVPSNSGLGGFKSGQQGMIDERTDRRETASDQKASFPSAARRGVIGADPGVSGAQVEPLCTAAKALGLDFVVFTPDASSVEKDADWNSFVEACRKASSGNFCALPGVLFRSGETGNTGVAFNLKKRWPEIPWRGEGFETFVRIGVNNDWESVAALVGPSKAPFPYANLGAFTAMDVSPQADRGARSGADELREAVSGGWKLMPINYRAVKNAEDLAAAAKQPTMLYLDRWPAKEGQHGRWDLASTGEGRISQFTVSASNTWEPAGYSAARAKAVVEGVREGAMLELYCWHRLLRRVPVVNGRADAEWEGILPGAGMFWLQAVDANGNTILQASPLAVAKITFSAFIGTDMMNGYWYPAKKVANGEKSGVLLGGSYGQLGTSVYPQLGWGGHWQFRTLNQIGEPLGFEIGSPPGGLPRMTAGYRWAQGNSLPELAPRRTMGVNTTQAVVWNDRGTVIRKDMKFAGSRHLSVAPFPGVKNSTMRTTGYRWWTHAALHFEAAAQFEPGAAAAGQEANLASALLGDPADLFGPLTIMQGGSESSHDMKEEVDLPSGAGATLGDRPMGMVSLWSLTDGLKLRVTRDGDKPVLSLWQAGQAGAAERSASFLLVISAHDPERKTSLEDVGRWLFDNAKWPGARSESAGFAEIVDLDASRGVLGTWQNAGKKWRGRLAGLQGNWDGAVVWREGSQVGFQEVPWSDTDGLSPVLFDKTPDGEVFMGNPVIASQPDIVISVTPSANVSDGWTVTAHNAGRAPSDAEVRTNPQLGGLVAPWSATAVLAPGETKAWSYKP